MLRLKELRKENGLTQKELAKQINYSQNLISTWEAGIHEPNISALITLANIFNVSVDYLIGNDSYSHNTSNSFTYFKTDKNLSQNKQTCIKDIIDLDEPLVLQVKVYLRGLKEASSIYKKQQTYKF